jgi:phosphatidylglycerophosphatase A
MANCQFENGNAESDTSLGGNRMTYQTALDLLAKRGVAVEQVAEIVHRLQSPYNADLTMEECVESVMAVLGKREVQYTLFTGIALDMLAEQKLLPDPLQSIMENDEALYGADETLALGIVHVYGMIGLTSFGYLDKEKTGIIRALNNNRSHIHVFLDDLVAGLAAAASARIAHQNKNARTYAAKRSEENSAS